MKDDLCYILCYKFRLRIVETKTHVLKEKMRKVLQEPCLCCEEKLGKYFSSDYSI